MYSLGDIAGSPRRVAAASIGMLMIGLGLLFFGTDNNIYKLYIFKNIKKQGRELHIMRYIINVEKIYDDKVWNNLTGFLKKKGKRCHLFLMAPQITFQKANLGYRGSKEELTKKLISRYKLLTKAKNKYKFTIGLRLYLSLQPHLLPEVEKHHSIQYVIQWMSKVLQQKITMISFGWDKCDVYSHKLCTVNKISVINDKWGAIRINDYDIPLKGTIGLWLKTVQRKLKGTRLTK